MTLAVLDGDSCRHWHCCGRISVCALLYKHLCPQPLAITSVRRQGWPVRDLMDIADLSERLLGLSAATIALQPECSSAKTWTLARCVRPGGQGHFAPILAATLDPIRIPDGVIPPTDRLATSATPTRLIGGYGSDRMTSGRTSLID